jgi:hypothetical protein
VGPAVPLEDRTYEKPLLPSAQPPYKAGPMLRDENQTYIDPTSCNVQESTQRQLCTTVSIGSAHKGMRTLEARVCSTSPSATHLTFGQRNELDFEVELQGDQVWRWSAWHPQVAAPHTLMLETGYCTVWHFDWSEVGFDGRKLPKGTSYMLKARFFADELRADPVAWTTFTIG